jgi:hypothetical protein
LLGSEEALRFPLFAWFFDGAGLVPGRCLS